MHGACSLSYRERTLALPFVPVAIPVGWRSPVFPSTRSSCEMRSAVAAKQTTKLTASWTLVFACEPPKPAPDRRLPLSAPLPPPSTESAPLPCCDAFGGAPSPPPSRGGYAALPGTRGHPEVAAGGVGSPGASGGWWKPGKLES